MQPYWSDLMSKKYLIPLVLLSLTVLIFASGCGSSGSTSAQTAALHMAPLSEMPREIQAAPAAVREAYQFAVANPEVVTELPCYCGCGPIGHKSNYACYVSGVEADGKISYDAHALGCSICVDITTDAMRLLKEGKDLAFIRTYVDDTYSMYGPTNMP
jgi:hypothetical protein